MKKLITAVAFCVLLTNVHAQKVFKKIPFSGTYEIYTHGTGSSLYKGDIELI